MSDWNTKIIEEFRANGGKVGGHFENTKLLLLHTKGAKSGQPRINPLATIPDGDRWVIVASKGGADSNPDWYYNVKANPEVTVEVGAEKFEGVAAVATEPERTELFEKVASHYRGFNDYKVRTDRVIPVITITPKPGWSLQGA